MDCLGSILTVHFPAARIAADVLTGCNLEQVQAQLMRPDQGQTNFRNQLQTLTVFSPKCGLFHIIFVFHDRKWVLSLGKKYFCDSIK